MSTPKAWTLTLTSRESYRIADSTARVLLDAIRAREAVKLVSLGPLLGSCWLAVGAIVTLIPEQPTTHARKVAATRSKKGLSCPIF